MYRLKQAVVWGFVLLLFAGAHASAADVKRVLILHSFGRNFSPFVNFTQNFQAELINRAEAPIDFYESSIFTARFEKRSDDRSLVAYLRDLFSDHRLDLIVTIGGPAAQFIQRHRLDVFPESPLLITTVAERLVSKTALTANDTVAATRIELAAFVENILRLRPETEEIFVALGDSKIENFWHSVLVRQFERFSDRVRFNWWNDLSATEMAQQAARLNARSAILYLVVYVDAKGVTHPLDGAFPLIRATAAAPMFGFGDYHLGKGIVGGPLRPNREYSRQAAQVALRLLNGGKPGGFQTMAAEFGAPVYDWRELQRWNISEARLPPGSVVMYREPSVWTTYRWQIAGIVAVLLLQAVLIARLIYQRRQRRLAEETARQRMAMLAYMNRRAEAGELSASIAHEVNQPIAAMGANADAALIWLTKKNPPDLTGAVAALEAIVSDVKRASEVISTVRAFYKADEQVREDVDLNKLVGEVHALLQSELQQEQISVRQALTGKLPPVHGDRVQIQQVILNLVLNAIEALKSTTDRERRIEIRTEADDTGDVLLTVEDSGPGIDSQELDRIFQPFYTTKPRGMGLGLAICRSIVEAHGGRLTAASGKSHGMVFRMAVPGAEARPVKSGVEPAGKVAVGE